MERITYAIIILAIIVLLLYVATSYIDLKEIKQTLDELNDKEQKNACTTDNGCDLCCKDCQDSDVCSGRCVHVKPEKGDNDDGEN